MREFRPVPKPTPKEKPPKKNIKQVSTKQAAALREYNKVRDEFLKENKFCVGRLEGCTIHATCVHHSKGRIGKLLTDVKHFKASCYSCNLRAETNPLEAVKMGFSKSRLHE